VERSNDRRKCARRRVSSMRFAVNVPGLNHFPAFVQQWEISLTSADYRRLVVVLDQLGFDYVLTHEHIVMPAEHVDVMGACWPDALTSMAFFAGCTERIQVSSNIIPVPFHNPIQMAKAVATLDLLSGGRVTLSVGVGGEFPREFDLLGVDFHQRGRVTDDYIDAMTQLWVADDPEHNGPYVAFHDVAFEPKPIQKPYPPLWVGGDSPAAMRRAARVGDGWIPSKIRVEELSTALEYIAGLRAVAGRTDPFDVCMPLFPYELHDDHRRSEDGLGIKPTRDASVEATTRLVDAGATVAIFRGWPVRSLEECIEAYQWFAREVIHRIGQEDHP
jgi:probable F420-dependent oxidoreductase